MLAKRVFSLGIGLLSMALLAAPLAPPTSVQARQPAHQLAAPLALTNGHYTPYDGPRQFFSPLALDFGQQGVGLTGSGLDVQVVNTGSLALEGFSGGSPGGGFTVTNNCPAQLQPEFACQYTFFFTPSAVGVVTATAHLSSSAGPIDVPLRGEGVGAGIYLNPLVLNFGRRAAFSGPSPVQSVRVYNRGKAVLTGISPADPGAPFGLNNLCPTNLDPGASCRVDYYYSPTSPGSFDALATIDSSAGTRSARLVGSSLRPAPGAHAWITPLELDFGPAGLGVTSPPVPITITNSGSDVLTNFAGGAPSGPFGGIQDCGAGGLQPGEACHYFFTFTPNLGGPVTGNSVTSTNGGTFTITLHGEGITPVFTVSAPQLDFGPFNPGQTSFNQLVKLSNPGLTPLALSQAAGSLAPFSLVSNSQASCANLAPAQNCYLDFNYLSPGPGRYHRTAVFNSNAGPIQIDLYGGEPARIYLPLVEQ